ncbi:MAG: GIY-YIG nuclease family protein [Candidatus Woesearchaeota archaeon]
MKGIYALCFEISKDFNIREWNIKKGRYVYVGSAQTNLEKRVNRHKKKNKKKHWHIDYLTTLKECDIKKVFYLEKEKLFEDVMTNILLCYGKPIDNFGASDSKFNSHLFKVKNFDFLKNYMFILNNND